MLGEVEVDALSSRDADLLVAERIGKFFEEVKSSTSAIDIWWKNRKEHNRLCEKSIQSII